MISNYTGDKIPFYPLKLAIKVICGICTNKFTRDPLKNIQQNLSTVNTYFKRNPRDGVFCVTISLAHRDSPRFNEHCFKASYIVL